MTSSAVLNSVEMILVMDAIVGYGLQLCGLGSCIITVEWMILAMF
jgi:hypothetical protein